MASEEGQIDHRGEGAPDGEPAAAFSEHMRHLILGVMMLGTGAACISQSMMISALPAIMGEFSVDATLGQLLTTAYIFTLGLISAISAFLVNRVNAKTLFLVAIGIFVVGCAAALFAPNYWLLLAARLFRRRFRFRSSRAASSRRRSIARGSIPSPWRFTSSGWWDASWR